MSVISYSHCNGAHFVPSEYIQALSSSLSKVPSLPSSSLTNIRSILLRDLRNDGWSGKYQLDVSTNISITSIRGTTGLCLQTGNASRFYADVMKLQYLYAVNHITNAVYVVPSSELAIMVGGNRVSFRRAVAELQLFQKIVTIPLFVVAIPH